MKNDINNIVNILPSLEEKYGNMNHGGCYVFAEIIRELTGINEYLAVIADTGIDDEPVTHFYVRIGKDRYLDSQGTYLYKELEDKWTDVYDEEIGESVDYVLIPMFASEVMPYMYDDHGGGFTESYTDRKNEIKAWMEDQININEQRKHIHDLLSE